MNTLLRHHSTLSLITFAAAVTLAGCGEQTVSGPADEPATFAFAAAARGLDLGQCDEIAVPMGSKLVSRLYAEGVQKYEWDGVSWAFRGPQANLYANAAGRGKVGIHYGGPTWESNSGSLVVGRLKVPCEVGPTDIPWLLLDVTRSEGPGIFRDVDYIQRVNTVGGRAPATPGTPGEMRHVPYTAEYYFYRAPRGNGELQALER